jgi:hypothetical protein
MTQNHDYNTPAEGTVDWHIPLNENFDRLDVDVEIRAAEAEKGNYDPKQGAKFLATDTGRTFLGDGEQWTALPSTGSLGSGVVVHRSGSDAVARTVNGIVASGPDHADVIQQAFDNTEEAVYFQKGQYDLQRQLQFDSSERAIHGNGAWLRAVEKMPSVLTLNPDEAQEDIAIRDLFIEGGWNAEKGLDLPACNGSHFERITVQGVNGNTIHCRYTDGGGTFQNNTFVACHLERGSNGHPGTFRATGDLAGDGSANANTLVECKIGVAGQGNACIYLEGECVDWTIIGGDFHTLDIAGDQYGLFADATADNGNVSDLKLVGSHIEVQDGTAIAGDGLPLHRWSLIPGYMHATTNFDRSANAYHYLYGGDMEISGTLTENA